MDNGGQDDQPRDWREMRRVEDLRAPPLRALLALWESRRKPGGRLPARADFQARDLLAFGGIITLLDVEHAPLRLRVRLVGTTVTEAVGRDNTGRYVDEVYDRNHLLPILRVYSLCIDGRRPIATTGRLWQFSKEYKPFESVDLPLATDGDTVDMIMKGSVFDDPVG